jgi:hypothetical protein
MKELFIVLAVFVAIGSVIYHTRKTKNIPAWQRLYFFVLNNAEKSDVYLKHKFAFRYGIIGYKAQCLIAAGKKHDQDSFKSLYESMSNTPEPLN